LKEIDLSIQYAVVAEPPVPNISLSCRCNTVRQALLCYTDAHWKVKPYICLHCRSLLMHCTFSI